ncbi:MAG: hypothetical protein GX489_02505 [Firmicutes bacterium]|nr:hypothetical protein [Bacillota bacterium]
MLKVLAIMAVILAIQLPLLIKEKQWRELAAFLTLWLVATVYASLVALNVIPNSIEILISVLDQG